MTDQEMEKKGWNLRGLKQVLHNLIVPLVNIAASEQEHEASVVRSQEGAQGLRYYNNSLEVYNDQTEQWDGIGSSQTALSIPTINGSSSFTYNGSEKTVSLNNIVSGKMIVTGNTGTDAGTYTAVVTLTNTRKYKWSDGTTAPKVFNWTITKANGNATLSKNSVTLDLGADTDTVSVTGATGEITVVSSDESIAIASYSNGVITISSPDLENGNASITVNIAASSNYNATTKTISVSSDFPQIYGAEWDGTSSLWTRTDKASRFSDPAPYVSEETGYSSPFDNIMPWAGMTVSERTGGTMVAIPKFYYKLTKPGAGLKIQIANEPLEGFEVSPAHKDRGDGQGERSVVYIGRYHCLSNYKSGSGSVPVNNISKSTARTSIHALGSNIWQVDFAMMFTIWLLYLVEYADWDYQKTIGYGGLASGSGKQSTGYTDSIPYHTGTSTGKRERYGLGTQYRNIEGLCNNGNVWIDGCYSVYGTYYLILKPSTFSDTSGGTRIGTLPSSGYPTEFDLSSAIGYTMFYPKKTSSSAGGTTDYWSISSSSTVQALMTGDENSSVTNGQSDGLFRIRSCQYNTTNSSCGCRLMELP